MRQALTLLRRSAGAGLAVHALRTGAALLLTWPLLRALSAAIDGHLFRAEARGVDAALVLEVVVEAATVPWMALCAGGYVLLSPLLSLFWLCVMHGRAERAAVSALALYPRALLLLLAVVPLSLPACLPGVTLALSQPILPESMQQAAALAGGSLSLLGLLAALAVHDVVRAALVEQRSIGRALSIGLRAVSPRMLLTRGAILLAAFSIGALGEAARTLPPALVLPTQQTAALALTACSGLWLALTVAATQRSAA